jgi:outer membrane protein TolC
MRILVLATMLLASTAASARAQEAQGVADKPLSLTDALEIAERESESVGLAQGALARAEGARRQARSAYFPQLTGSASYTRTLRSQFSVLQGEDEGPAAPVPEECDAFIPRPGLPVEERLDSLEAAVECASNADPFAGLGNDLPFGRENTYRLGLSFSQTLFSGGRVTGQTQSANADVRSATIGLTAARAQLLLDVTEAYYDATLGDRLVNIARATLRQADTTLSQARLARQVGDQSEFDLLRARVTRDNQRPVVIQRQAARDLAYYRLKNLLNIPLEQPLTLTSQLVGAGEEGIVLGLGCP